MAKFKKKVNGQTIEIDDDDNLQIAGKSIDYIHDAESNKWSSRYLPYTQYDSLEDLGKEIAKNTEEFKEPQG